MDEQLKKTGFGWIYEGKVFACEKYGHFDSIIKSKLCPKKIKDNWEVMEKELDDCRQDSEDLIEKGEHPEWHVYEIFECNYHGEITRQLYAEGFIRVGIDEAYRVLGFEGKGFAFKANYDLLQSIKEEYPDFEYHLYERETS